MDEKFASKIAGELEKRIRDGSLYHFAGWRAYTNFSPGAMKGNSENCRRNSPEKSGSEEFFHQNKQVWHREENRPLGKGPD